MSPEDLIVIDARGKKLDGVLDPSSEIKLHLRILVRRPDCQAVVHAHPPLATGFSVAGESIPEDLLPEAIYVLGRVALLPFAMPGTDEVAEGLEPYVRNHKTFLLSHHGAAAMGKDLWDACYRMETLERVARIVFTARMLGGPKAIPDAARDRLLPILNGDL